MKKRGQVTLFIILGLSLAIIVGLGIYLFSGSKESQFVKPQIEVDEKYAPVQVYVQECMNQILLDGITRLGLHGGYIDLDDPLLSGRIFDRNIINQYNSDAAYLSVYDPGSSVAYWLYTSSSSDCDNCRVGTLAPSLQEMEQQLNKYMQRNMASCLDEYSVFNDMGYAVLDSKNYSIRTSITDQGVAAILETDVYIKINNDEGRLDIFYTETNLPLKKYHEMATVMVVDQIKNNYLENVALYLLNTHSSLDPQKLPPFHEITDGYEVVYWSKINVRQRFEGLLTSYINALRVPNTRNYANIDDSRLSASEKYFYNATRLDFFEGKDLSNTEISFIYAGQDIFMDIEPSDGELLKPSTYKPEDYSNMFRGRIINNYDFFYEISYPVIVEIRDEYAPGSEYTFMFAMEGTIINNLRIKDYYNDSMNLIDWDKSLLKTRNAPIDQNVDISGYNLDSRLAQQIYAEGGPDPLQGSSQDTRLCNENRRTSGNVTLRTYDSVNGMAIDEVDVTFICGNYIGCDMGRSIYDNILEESEFTSKFPACRNGYIKLSKQGYLPKNILLSTDTKTAQNLGSVYLDPLMATEYQVKKYDVQKKVVSFTDSRSYSIAALSSDLTANESIIITMEKILYEKTDEPYVINAVLSKEYGSLDRNVTLAPGTYSLRIQLIDSKGVVIPKECERVCTDTSVVNKLVGSCDDYEYFPKDNIEIKPAPWGGIEFTNRTLVYITPQNLMSGQILQFNVLKYPDPSCLKDMEDISKTAQLSQEYKTLLLPEFVPRE